MIIILRIPSPLSICRIVSSTPPPQRLIYSLPSCLPMDPAPLRAPDVCRPWCSREKERRVKEEKKKRALRSRLAPSVASRHPISLVNCFCCCCCYSRSCLTPVLFECLCAWFGSQSHREQSWHWFRHGCCLLASRQRYPQRYQKVIHRRRRRRGRNKNVWIYSKWNANDFIFVGNSGVLMANGTDDMADEYSILENVLGANCTDWWLSSINRTSMDFLGDDTGGTNSSFSDKEENPSYFSRDYRLVGTLFQGLILLVGVLGNLLVVMVTLFVFAFFYFFFSYKCWWSELHFSSGSESPDFFFYKMCCLGIFISFQFVSFFVLFVCLGWRERKKTKQKKK